MCWFSPGSAKPCHPCFKLAVLGTFSEVFFFFTSIQTAMEIGTPVIHLLLSGSLSVSVSPSSFINFYFYLFFFFACLAFCLWPLADPVAFLLNRSSVHFIFHGRIMALEYWVGFCYPSAGISHGYTRVLSRLSLPASSLPIPPLSIVTGLWDELPGSQGKFPLAI